MKQQLCNHPSFCYQRRTEGGLWAAVDAADATIKRCMSCKEQLPWGPSPEPDEQAAISLVAAEIMAGGVMTDLHRRGYDRYWAGGDTPRYEQSLTWQVGYLVAAMGDDLRQDVGHMTSTWEAIKNCTRCDECGAPLGGLCKNGPPPVGLDGVTKHCPTRVDQAFESVLLHLLVAKHELATVGDRLTALVVAAQRLLDDGIHHHCPTCDPLVGKVANAIYEARRPLGPDLPLALRCQLDQDP